MTHKTTNINIRNKKAYFEFEIMDKMVAGIQLLGTEIKSIRLGKASLVDSYCHFAKNELYVKNLHIAEYDWGTCNNHDARRERKLLLNRKELNKLQRKTKETGFTIVPTRMFITDKGLAKIEIALARGKKNYDKRETLKRNDAKRDMDRMRKF